MNTAVCISDLITAITFYSPIFYRSSPFPSSFCWDPVPNPLGTSACLHSPIITTPQQPVLSHVTRMGSKAVSLLRGAPWVTLNQLIDTGGQTNPEEVSPGYPIHKLSSALYTGFQFDYV